MDEDAKRSADATMRTVLFLMSRWPDDPHAQRAAGHAQAALQATDLETYADHFTAAADAFGASVETHEDAAERAALREAFGGGGTEGTA